MLTLRPDWRKNFGPLDLSMPSDPPPSLGDFQKALREHTYLEHEDSTDALNPDGTWGPPDPGQVGGSGICFGYSCSDLQAVLVAEQAVYARAQWYDWGHWIRQIRYSIAAYEMTHDPRFSRRIVEYANKAHAAWSETGPVSYGQGWTPENIAQYLDMAKKGLRMPGSMGREVGWVAYGEAMAHKVQPSRSTAWIEAFLETCSKAALPSGQIVQDAHAGVDQMNVEYTFHASIRNQAVLACCYRIRRRAPRWLLKWAENILLQEPMTYGGNPAPPAFLYTSGDKLVPATGPAQDGDPAHGWWSSLCVSLFKVTGDPTWILRAAKFGPDQWTEEQSRKETQLLRGLLG